MKVHKVTIAALILTTRPAHAFGKLGDEDIFVPMFGRRKVTGKEKDRAFTDVYDPEIRVKVGDSIIAVLEDNGKKRRCAIQWTTESIWNDTPSKKTEKKPVAKKGQADSQKTAKPLDLVSTNDKQSKDIQEKKEEMVEVTAQDKRMFRVRQHTYGGGTKVADQAKLKDLADPKRMVKWTTDPAAYLEVSESGRWPRVKNSAKDLLMEVFSKMQKKHQPQPAMAA